jgi:hypothetical protein
MVAERGRRRVLARCVRPVAADDDHADFVALGGRSVLDAVVQHDVHELRAGAERSAGAELASTHDYNARIKDCDTRFLLSSRSQICGSGN